MRRDENALDVSSRDMALDCTPVKNRHVDQERTAEGVMLIYPVEVKPWARRLMRLFGADDRPANKKLQLDPLGSQVWDLMDGEARVRDIAARFAKSRKLHKKEAEVAVCQFLRDLGRRGIVAMK
ncbi:MAG: PqqD family protein [Desulfatibacillaceae bacterium]